jgi:pyruvate,water dikinase
MGYVLEFQEIDHTRVAVVGGKGARLGELSRTESICVPPGFCVTTDASRRIIAEALTTDDRLDRLSRLKPDDREAIRALSAEIRRAVEGIAIPDDVALAITRALVRLGAQAACAVRSSATAEDSPTASFAGQYDSYLNVVGPGAVLRHVSRCWASLFSERAVTYRLRNGFDHRKVQMAVVVQQMVVPHAAGILFTADPVTSSRKVASVEASFGLGEALVSGLVNADTFKVRQGEVVARAVAIKQRAIHASPMSGTEELPVAPARQEQPALTDAQVVRLVQLGRRIEAHFGHPQDIEWCLADDGFWIVQSRPITTLFPIPEAADRENHVYVSVGHQQMMTDPMKPLGLSVWQLTTPRPMAVAGGRLFVDVTPLLASPTSRAAIVKGLGGSDPLIGDALQAVLDRGFVRSLPDEALGDAPAGRVLRAMEIDPADRPVKPDQLLVAELIERSRASIAALRDDIRAKSGSELLDFIAQDIDEELKGNLFDPRSLEVITATMNASRRLNEDLSAWLGERNAVDVLTQSVPGNVTSEMGLALMDVADVIRPHAEVVAFLEQVDGDGFLDEMAALAGGRAARAAIEAYLERYGIRCAGEIDITRPRWSEHPSALVPMILTNVTNFEPGAGRRRFEAGRQEAGEKEQEVLDRVRGLPGGEEKAVVAKRLIDRVRILSGYREYPKYGMVSRYAIYKQALLEEAERLVQAGVLREREDIFYLWFDELKEVVRTRRVDERLIGERKDAFRSYQALTPPRVLTSDGEVIAGAYRRDDVPTGALIGLPVSAGTIEGRARVIRDIAQADIEAGDILVTTYTDPSWTPLFLAIKGLVTEVGGLMTHGAVIAREYGLPAVVGVENATNLIRDGQRIRVHGTDGYIEILGDPGQTRDGDAPPCAC